MSQLTNIIATGVLTITASLGGVYLTNKHHNELWRKDVTSKLVTELWTKRIETYRLMSAVLADSQRIVLHNKAAGGKGASKLVSILVCATADEDRTTPSCQFAPNERDDLLAKEIFDTQSRFEAVRVSASIYFCERTRIALGQIPEGVWWWSASSARKLAVLSAMKAEITCQLETLWSRPQ